MAKPLFDVLADSPDFFVARGNTTGDIVLFALGVVLVPPTLLLAAELLLGRWPRARELLHLIFVGALLVALLMQIFKSVRAGPGLPLTGLALAGGVGGALLYERSEPARSVLTVLSPTPVLFLVLFLGFSPVNDLFESNDVPVRHDVRRSAPVVMVVFDEFSVEALMTPNGKIDAARYPNFAALSRSSTWYRNVTTVSDHTTDAVPAILTGRYPVKGAVPTAASHPRNLFTLLGGAYSMRNVTEPATNLCPTQLCAAEVRPAQPSRMRSLTKDLTIVQMHRVLPQRLADKLPDVSHGFGNFAGQGRDKAAASSIPGLAFENRTAQFNRFLDRLDGRGLNFIHVLLPHTAYEFLPTGQSYPAPPGKDIPGLDDDGFWTKDGALPQQSLVRMEAQTGYADRLIGRLIAQLKARGLWDRALVVVVADHGISFRPGASRRTATGPGAPDVLGMPLFVKLPDQSGGKVDDRHATTADVLPTIADALDIHLGWPVDGMPLEGPPRPDSDPVVVSIFPSRDKVSMPFDDYVHARDAQVNQMRFAAGPRGGWAGVYARGIHSDLFGRRVASLPRAASAGLRAKLDRPAAFGSVKPGAASVPAVVTGTIEGASTQPLNVAVAVNGVVWAIAPTYASGGDTRFGALLAPEAFRSPVHGVRLYEVSDKGELRTILTSRDG